MRRLVWSGCLLAAGATGLWGQGVDFERAGEPVRAGVADPAIAAAMGRVSAARLRATIERLVGFGTRNTLSSVETGLPAGTGALAAADWIHGEFAAISAGCGGCLEVKDDTFTYTPPAGEAGARSRFRGPTPLHDVYAVMRGSDPAQSKRMYLVTGHYDTRVTDVMNARSAAPGANDDSSGTAVSLECARVLAGMKLPATVVFVAVAGEEQGLTGSEHLAALAKREGWQLEGVLNNDIVGGDTTPGDALQRKDVVRVFSQGLLPMMPAAELRTALVTGADNDTPSRELAREVLAVGRTYGSPGDAGLRPVMELRLDRYLRGGDHSMFSAQGFPAVRFTEWRENFDHQHQDVRTENGVVYGDLLQFDDFGYIAKVARLNAATLAELASGPGMPGKVRVVTRELDNNTTLEWEAPAAASGAVRYEVVWREAAANDWQYRAWAEQYPAKGVAGLGATVPVSKDNVFFGVRACDAAGHCSQAVAPEPER